MCLRSVRRDVHRSITLGLTISLFFLYDFAAVISLLRGDKSVSYLKTYITCSVTPVR